MQGSCFKRKMSFYKAMKIYLFNQIKCMSMHLERLKTAAPMPYKLEELREVVSAIPINIKTLTEVDWDVIFRYRIFPSNILAGYGEWVVQNRPIQVGDTIVQQVYIPPNQVFSQKLIFGARVNEIINEPHRRGFSYETLEGHVEKGISTFVVQKSALGFEFVIHTFSAPGNLLSKLLGPIFSLPYQKYCTAKALQNVKRQLENRTS